MIIDFSQGDRILSLIEARIWCQNYLCTLLRSAGKVWASVIWVEICQWLMPKKIECERFFPLVNKTGDLLKTSFFGKWKKMHTAKKVKQEEIGPKQKDLTTFFFPRAKICDRSRSNSRATKSTACWVSAKQPDAVILKISSTAEYPRNLTAIKMRNRNWHMEEQGDDYCLFFSVQSFPQGILKKGEEDTGFVHLIICRWGGLLKELDQVYAHGLDRRIFLKL